MSHTITSCDAAILDFLKICATPSMTLTDVSRQSTELVVCSQVNFVLIGPLEEKIIKCAPKCKASPLPVSRQSPLGGDKLKIQLCQYRVCEFWKMGLWTLDLGL